MKKIVTLVAALCFSLIGCQSAPPTGQGNAVQPVTSSSLPKKFGWKKFHEETFEANTGGGKYWLLPTRISKLRVSVDANSAVFAGVIPESTFLRLKMTHERLPLSGFGSMPCALLQVDKSEVSCVVDNHRKLFLIVEDSRQGGTVIAGLAGFFRRSPKLMDHAALPNKVALSLSSWECIENCAAAN